MLKVGESNMNRSSWLEIHASGQINVRLLPESVESVIGASLSIDFYFRYWHSLVCELRSKCCMLDFSLSCKFSKEYLWKTYLIYWIRRKRSFELLENVIDMGVPTVENGVPHGCGWVSHYTKAFLEVSQNYLHIRCVWDDIILVYQRANIFNSFLVLLWFFSRFSSSNWLYTF